jgi:hypothetical protein
MQLSQERDLPLLKLIRDTTYISRPQLHVLAPQVGIREDTKNLNRRLRRLVDSGLALAGKPWPPFAGTVYCISHAGLLALENNGQASEAIKSSSEKICTPNQIGHFLMLNRIRIGLQGWRDSFVLCSWHTDRQIKAWNIIEQRYAKDYDGVVELARNRPADVDDGDGQAEVVRLGIEYERTFKSYDAYDRITAALNRETKVDAVLYFTDSVLDARKILALVHPDRLPVISVTAAGICQDDAPFETPACVRASNDGPWYTSTLFDVLWFLQYISDLHTNADSWRDFVESGDFAAYSS